VQVLVPPVLGREWAKQELRLTLVLQAEVLELEILD
jgi:hypothetical protein